jgi:hypothetical protein
MRSGGKKAHDLVVDQLTDLFRTTHRVKTLQVARIGLCKLGDLSDLKVT